MKKSSIENMELGNLLFGNSRGEYEIDREKYQDIFCDFLEEIGFDSYGFAPDYLEEYIKTDYAPVYNFHEQDKVKAKDLKEKGKLLESTMQEDIYLYQDKRYAVIERPNMEYEKAHEEWFNEFFDCEDELLSQELLDREPLYQDYGTVEEVYDVEEKESYQHYFDNGTFLVRPYYWGDSDEIAEKPNFVFYPENIEISWYKYPLRDAYCSQNLTKEQFEQMLKICKDSLKSKNKTA